VIHAFADRLAAKFEDEHAEENAHHRLTHKRLRAHIDRAADLTEEYDDVSFGETARENVINAIWSVMATVPDDPPLVRELNGDRDATSNLVDAMRATDIMAAPPTRCLAPISEDLITAGLEKEFDAEFYSSATRDAGVSGGDPFIVEAGIAYGGELPAEGTGQVMRALQTGSRWSISAVPVRRRMSSNRSVGATTGSTSPAAPALPTGRS